MALDQLVSFSLSIQAKEVRLRKARCEQQKNIFDLIKSTFSKIYCFCIFFLPVILLRMLRISGPTCHTYHTSQYTTTRAKAELGVPLQQILQTFPATNLTFHFKKLLQTFSVKTNFPFYKTNLRIMILTFHILKLGDYHNINIYILILILHNIKLNYYYKTKVLAIILTSAL